MTIYIESQLSLRDGEVDEPKRNSVGWIGVIPKYWDRVLEWREIDDKDRGLYEALYDFVTTKSKALWPKNRLKHISPHDLRHSHAIYLLENGLRLEDVAKNLRNSILTCQKYYTGFAHTEGTVRSLMKQLNDSASYPKDL
jgi:integrase